MRKHFRPLLPRPILKLMKILLLFISAMIVWGQGCGPSNSIQFLSNGPSTSSNNTDSGNGQGYDGKLTFVSVQDGFTCENKPAPTSILRRSELGAWSLTVNQTDKCASIDSQPVFDVFYNEQVGLVIYQNSIFYQPVGREATGSASLDNNLRYFNVLASANANSADALAGDGICANSLGQCSLRAAIDETNFDVGKMTLISVPAGIYTVTGSSSFYAALTLSASSTTILRGVDPVSTIIDGDSINVGTGLLHLTQSGQNSLRVIENMGFMNGRNSELLDHGAALTLEDRVVLRNCSVSNNLGGGSAVNANSRSKEIYIINSKITDNANTGFGVRAATRVTIDQTEFLRNSMSGFFMGNDTSNVLIKNSTFAFNTAYGIVLRECMDSCRIENTTVFGSGMDGISISHFSSSLPPPDIEIFHTTVADNARNSGGNVSVSFQSADPRNLLIRNSILSVPLSGRPNLILQAVVGLTIQGDSSICDDSSCNGLGFSNVNPLLLPLAANGGPTQTMLPSQGSPAIDAGEAAYCNSSDQRGFIRPVDKLGSGAKCDIGATEIQ